MRSKKTATAVPAARSDGLLIEPIGDETVIYDTESKQAHCLKPLAAIVFGHCDGHATVGDIASSAQQRLGAAVSDSDVSDAVAQLETLGLLQSALIVRAGGGLVATNGGVSRREMIRRVGLAGAGAAVGTSLITSIVPPAALAASTIVIPLGCPGCTTNSNCVGANGNPGTGHCCQSIQGKCNNSCCVLQNNSCHVRSGTCVGGPTPGIPCSFDVTCGSGGTCSGQCTSCNPTATNPCPTSCPGGQAPCCDTLGSGGCLAGVDDEPPPP